MPRPVHLAGQRLRRRPDKCDAGCRRHKLHITRFRRCRRRKLAHSAAPPSSHRNRFAGFRRESCWEVIKTPVLHFFGVPAWGWYHYPRRALYAVETLDARGSRRLICRFYAASEFAPCGQNAYPQRVLSPARCSERTQRLTRANTERFRRLRHRQGR